MERVIQIVGYMVGVYAIWRMIDVLATDYKTAREIMAVIGVLGMMVCLVLLNSQGDAINRLAP